MASTDWTSAAALVAAIIALAGFLISAIRGRRADDMDTLVTSNDELRKDVTDLRIRVTTLENTLKTTQSDLTKCQRENRSLKRRLNVA